MLRVKCPEAKGNLQARIDQAVKAGVLTAELARYAHTIRLEGNEAAHGTYNEADAEQLRLLMTLAAIRLHPAWNAGGDRRQSQRGGIRELRCTCAVTETGGFTEMADPLAQQTAARVGALAALVRER